MRNEGVYLVRQRCRPSHALRLQALAAVNGLAVFVPPVHTRQSPMTVLPSKIKKKVAQSDVILGVVGSGFEQACSLEMNTGIVLRKSMIVMSNPQFENALRPHFGPKLVVIDPANPALTESTILQHLTTMDQNKKNGASSSRNSCVRLADPDCRQRLMRTPRCTIDSSCVIALDHLDHLPKLSFLFSQVLLPKAVRNDLFRRTGTKKRVQSLFRTYAFVEPCDAYDKGAVDILLAERDREGTKDRGEAEAVVQAAQIGAMVIVDDQWGRELAAQGHFKAVFRERISRNHARPTTSFTPDLNRIHLLRVNGFEPLLHLSGNPR
jgi:predicted nucleic acid-binding protein